VSASAFGFDTHRHRLTLDGFDIPSVTQILGDGLPKPALKFWAAKSVAEWAYDHRDAWKDLPRDAAVDLLKREPLRFTKKKANVGTAVHAAVNAYAEGAEVPELNDEEYGYYNAALAYLDEQQVEVLRSEATVYSRTHHYGGTFDLLARKKAPYGVDPNPATIRDFKTSKAVYPDVALQLVAYARADFIGDAATGEEIPLPPVTEGEIVRLDSSGSYEAVPVALDDAVWETFLHVFGVRNWTRELAPTVLKPALRRAA
jgi:hypothetical protein